MKKRSFWHEILFYVLILGSIVLVLSTLLGPGKDNAKLTYDDVIRYFDQNQVKSVEVSPKNILTMTVIEDGAEKTVSYKLKDFGMFHADIVDRHDNSCVYDGT